MSNIKREPVLISVLVGNLIALAVSFGLSLTEVQTAAIMGLVSTLTVVIFGRSAVTPNVDVVVVDKGNGAVASTASVIPTGTPVTVTDASVVGE